LLNGGTAEKLLDEKGGILGNYQARADLAYCLGLIPKGAFQNLLLLGQIRNTFAHSHLNMDFHNPKIVPLCEKLVYPTVHEHVSVDASSGKKLKRSPFEETDTPRNRFVLVLVILFQRLLADAANIERRAACSWTW
jgi:DNA-binding MltR family transcriptional regulator